MALVTTTATAVPSAVAGIPSVRHKPGLAERLITLLLLLVITTDLPFTWFNPDARKTQEGADSTLMAILLMLTAALVIFTNGHWREFWFVARSEPLILTIHALMLSSFLWATYPDVAIRQSVSVMIATFIGFYLVTRYSQIEIFLIAAKVLAFTVLMSFFFVFFLPEYGLSAPDPNALDADVAWTGIYSQKNALGAATTLGVFVFAVAARSDRRRRVWWYSMTLVTTIGVVFSQAKTSLVALILAIGLLVLYQAFRARKTLYGAVAVGLLTSIVTGVLFVTANLAFLANRLDKDVTLTGRTPLWTDVITYIRAKPILGYGWSGFWGGWFSPSHEIWTEHTWVPTHAHNALLEYLIHLGIVGAAIMLALYIRSIARCATYVRVTKGVYGLWPLGYVSIGVLYSITESGILDRGLTWVLFVAAVTTVGTSRQLYGKNGSARPSPLAQQPDWWQPDQEPASSADSNSAS